MECSLVPERLFSLASGICFRRMQKSQKGTSLFRRFDMTERRKNQAVVLLLALASLMFAVPASAQVEKATVKINGMI